MYVKLIETLETRNYYKKRDNNDAQILNYSLYHLAYRIVE